MSTFSTIAATILVVVGIAAAIPVLRPGGGGNEPTSLAFQPPAAADQPPAQADGGADPQASQAIASDVVPPSWDECMVEPRSREEVLEILSIAPAEDRDDHGYREVPVDQIPLDELNQTYREWQVCTRLGLTWQAMALESDSFIRMDIYGTWDIIDRGPMRVPYSEATLNEILDGRELMDAYRYESIQDAIPRGMDTPGWLLVVDEGQPAMVSEDGTSIIVSVAKYFHDGQVLPRNSGTIRFEFVDGQWLLADTTTLFFQ